MPTVDVGLRHDEAIQLGYALVDFVARANGIRAMAIKGLANSFHSLRSTRTPSDVDVLVDPDGHASLIVLLKERGWAAAGELSAPHAFAGHAVTLRHELWPCTLDIHRKFPGFFADPTVAFDALWATRAPMPVGGRAVWVPGKAASVIVLALHSQRSSRVGRARRELDDVLNRTVALTEQELAEVAKLAEETGAVWPLRDVLTQLGAPFGDLSEPPPPELREWRALTRRGFAASDVWLSQFASARWVDKPRVLWRAVWPSRHDLRVAHPETGAGVPAEVVVRVTRWGRGLAAAPRALIGRWRR